MSEKQTPIVDRLYAKVMYDGLSALCVNSSMVARIIVGNNPTRWHLTSSPPNVREELASDGAPKWALLQRDGNASLNPAKRLLRLATVFYADTNALEEQQRLLERPTLTAVAFTVGEAIVAGVIRPQGLHGDYTSVALRQDRRDRLAAIGLLDIDAGHFTAAQAGTKILDYSVPLAEFGQDTRFKGVPVQ